MSGLGFQIRQAIPADLDGVRRVLHAVWPYETCNAGAAYRQIQANGLVVAETTGHVIGFCSGFPLPTRWEVDLLAVAPGHQAQGVGRSLIHASLQAAPSHTVARAVIAVTNTASQRAFQAAGFTTDSIPRTLLICTPQPGDLSPRAAVTLHRVDTLLYRGIWVEPHHDDHLAASIAYGRAVAAAENRNRFGLFVAPTHAPHLIDMFGAARVGEYHWWHTGRRTT